MRLFELIFEAAKAGKMENGMLVQSLEQFVKSNGIQPAHSTSNQELEEEGEWKPIEFNPTIKPKFTQKDDTEKQPSRDDSYSKTISPEDLANLMGEKNGYVVYYDEPSPEKGGPKTRRRLNEKPIIVRTEKIQELAKEAEDEILSKFPTADNKTRKSKAYLLLTKKLEQYVLENAKKLSQEVANALSSGKVKEKQLKVDKFITKGKSVQMPSVHKSSVPIIDDNNEIIYDLDALAATITARPETILKVNAKMQKAGLNTVTMANLGIPAISGLVVDEKSKEFKIVNTCPGAGECKAYCYATRGGYVQYSATFESQAKTLNFWYNDPEGFKQQVIKEVKELIKPGTKTYIRWHDSGDFFDNAYLNLAFDVARAVPEANFYAYTKIAGVATSDMPENFVINFSQGAKPKETKQINLKDTKHSVVVPAEMFKDKETTGIGLDALKARDPEAQQKMKEAISEKYGVDLDTILTYDEMLNTPEEKDKPYYNVMIVPGLDGDLAAARKDVLGSYLLYH